MLMWGYADRCYLTRAINSCVFYQDDLLYNRPPVQCVQVYDNGHASINYQRVRSCYHVHIVVHLGSERASYFPTTGRVRYFFYWR